MATQYGYHPSGIYPPSAQPSQDDALLSSMSAMSLEGSTLPPSGAPAQFRQEQSQYPGSTHTQSQPSGASWSPPLAYGSSNSPSSNIPHMHESLYSAPIVGNTLGHQNSCQPQVGQQHAPSTDMKWGITDTHTQFSSPAQPVSNNYSISASSPAIAYAPSPQIAYTQPVAGQSGASTSLPASTPAQYQLPYQQPQNAPSDGRGPISYQQPPGTTSISSGFPNAQSYYSVPASQPYSQLPPAPAIASGSSNTYTTNIAHQGYQDQRYASPYYPATYSQQSSTYSQVQKASVPSPGNGQVIQPEQLPYPAQQAHSSYSQPPGRHHYTSQPSQPYTLPPDGQQPYAPPPQSQATTQPQPQLQQQTPYQPLPPATPSFAPFPTTAAPNADETHDRGLGTKMKSFWKGSSKGKKVAMGIGGALVAGFVGYEAIETVGDWIGGDAGIGGGDSGWFGGGSTAAGAGDSMLSVGDAGDLPIDDQLALANQNLENQTTFSMTMNECMDDQQAAVF